MKAYASFDDYLAGQRPQNRATIGALRDFVKRVEPGLSEAVKWGNGCWVGKKGPVAYVYAATGYVQFGFFRGSSLKDPTGLLEGEGKYVRHVKVHDPSDIDERAYAALLRQAARLRSGPSTEAGALGPSSMWSIRPASAEDALPLSELAERTFRETFAPLNTGEDMDRHCSRFYGLAIQAKEIASPKIATFVAAAEGSLIGYAQVHERASPSCIRTEPAVELRRLYVESSWHGKGVAQALMTAAIDEAKYRSAAALWLGVWEHNDRAIRFYRRQGFTEIGEQPFVLGRDVQRDIVMVILLRKAA